MNKIMKNNSDEEEDLEALRLAALQTIKKKKEGNLNNGALDYGLNHVDKPPWMMHHRNKGGNKRGQYFGAHGRGPKNGSFNNRIRNPNLIAITTIDTEETLSGLKLPQNLFTKSEPAEENSSSKFSRYNDSDKSESESDNETNASSDDNEDKLLERTDSLEALMQELDDEIQGKAKLTPESKSVKPKPKKLKKDNANLSDTESKPKPDIILSCKEDISSNIVLARRSKSKSPLLQTPPVQKRKRQPRIYNNHFNNFHQTFSPPSFENPPPIVPLPFNPNVAPPPLVLPPHPYHPLSIIPPPTTTPILAPLSPRSAAFVLQNRAIIEKRKRRSYSRSPSPRPRRQRSPPPPRRSLSPRSPRRRSLSPPREKKERKPPVRERLGVVKTPEEKPVEESVAIKSEDELVLEARKRKFESNEINVKEGVIRLKTKDEDEELQVPVKDDDVLSELEDELDLNANDFDIFSDDDDSSSGNEGRFKAKNGGGQNNGKVAVFSFSKLVNGSKPAIEREGLDDRRPRRERTRDRKKSSRSRRVETKDKRFERKIEIKIKHPAKYEGAKEERKVQVDKVKKRKEEAEIVDEVRVSDGEESTGKADGGDLRAQLSKKRAERLTHKPAVEGVSSRLLQNALQGAVFKTKKPSVKDVDSPSADGKVPIHLRLGIANNADNFSDTKLKRKRKHKTRSEQV